jgi:hypothetical protein
MNTREFQLILYCATSRPPGAPIQDLISKSINWPIVLQLAEEHGVRPMLLRGLKLSCWDLVPRATQIKLECFNKANVQRNLLFTSELLRLVSLFQQNGIMIAAFKGPVLAESVYGDLSLREFCDIDVLVQEADLDKAEEVLTAQGYQADFPDRDLRSAFLRYPGQHAFRNRHSGISIDLHWRLSSKIGKGVAFPIPPAEIWSNLRRVTVAGRTVLTLANDDLALFLTVHGTKEGWRSLVWVCDFAEFLRKHQDVDWIAVFERAQRAHCCRPLLLGILLAYTLLGARVPSELLKKSLNDPAVRALAQKIQIRMLRPAPKSEFAEFLDSLSIHDKLRDRLGALVSLLTTRTLGDYRSLPLPKPFWSAYYIIRPFRLVGKLVFG